MGREPLTHLVYSQRSFICLSSTPVMLTLKCFNMRRRLCEDIGVDLEARGTAVIDHVDHVVSEGYGHTSVLADGFTSSDAILGGFMSKVAAHPAL